MFRLLPIARRAFGPPDHGRPADASRQRRHEGGEARAPVAPGGACEPSRRGLGEEVLAVELGELLGVGVRDHARLCERRPPRRCVT